MFNGFNAPDNKRAPVRAGGGGAPEPSAHRKTNPIKQFDMQKRLSEARRKAGDDRRLMQKQRATALEPIRTGLRDTAIMELQFLRHNINQTLHNVETTLKDLEDNNTTHAVEEEDSISKEEEGEI